MLKKRRTLLVITLPSLALFGSHPVEGQAVPEYEIYAIEYGRLPLRPLVQFLPGADSSLTTELSAMVWLIKGPDGHNILVDAGYRPDYSNATSRQIQGYLSPDQAVAKLGVSAEAISDIILTHLHWDHADGLPLFPAAHVWVQKAELEYYADASRWPNADPPGVLPRYVSELISLNREGRVTLVDGDDQEIFEGIRAYTGPKHTFASQYLGVHVSGGTVILASDALWFYANLEMELVNSVTLDPRADLIAFERMKRLASRPEWIIPGHDPAVFHSFPSPLQGVARIR